MAHEKSRKMKPEIQSDSDMPGSLAPGNSVLTRDDVNAEVVQVYEGMILVRLASDGSLAYYKPGRLKRLVRPENRAPEGNEAI